MPYVEGFTVHDADAHVMELPGEIERYVEPRLRAEFAEAVRKPNDLSGWAEKARAQQADPEFRAGDEANLLLRKNHQALGAFRREDRPRSLDLLGFASQLVFTTHALGNYGLEEAGRVELALAGARAHNRMMADFCSVDGRLLATGYVPLLDIEAAQAIAREAIDLGCRGLMVPSLCPPGHSPSHVGLDPLWALLEEAGLPVLFHVGGEEKMKSAYFENGLPRVLDFHGGAENFTSLSFMTIPVAIWQTLAALVFDGVFDRFPRLKFGAIELGASWIPSLMKFMDFAPRPSVGRSACSACRPGRAKSCSASSAPRPIRTRTWPGSSPMPARRSACSRRTSPTSKADAIRSSGSVNPWKAFRSRRSVGSGGTTSST